MLKLFHLFIPLLIINYSYGQKTVDVSKSDDNIYLSNYRGNVFVDKYVTVVKGTPYFKEEWLKSNIIGALNKPVAIKLDLLANEVHFRDQKGQELVAVTDLNQIVLTDSMANERYKFIHSSVINTSDKIEPGWYQQLVDGKATLYKFYKKSLSENKPYGSATTEQTIETSTQYYLLLNGDFTEIKKFNDLPELLTKKTKEVSN